MIQFQVKKFYTNSLLRFFFSSPGVISIFLSHSVSVLGHPRVIHRDIKSSNILLDENFKARVSTMFSRSILKSNLCRYSFI